jgi:hypothetical protein
MPQIVSASGNSSIYLNGADAPFLTKHRVSEVLPAFLRGKFAAREVYEDILRVAPPDYCYISDPSQTSQVVDKQYIRDWVKRRVEKNIKVRAIRAFSDKPISDPIFAENPKLLRQVRQLPASIVIRSTVYIYGNNIGIISGTREKNAVIIYSPDLAFSGRQIFEMLWGMCSAKAR